MSDQPHPAGPEPLPPGARLLAVHQAVDALVSGDHPEDGQGSLAVDGGLIELLRQGYLIACRLPDGRISFTPNPDTAE
jgi:hypothetical protein